MGDNGGVRGAPCFMSLLFEKQQATMHILTKINRTQKAPTKASEAVSAFVALFFFYHISLLTASPLSHYS